MPICSLFQQPNLITIMPNNKKGGPAQFQGFYPARPVGAPFTGRGTDYSKLKPYYPNGGIPGVIGTQQQVDHLAGWHQSNLKRNLNFFPRAAATAVGEFGRFFARSFDFENMAKEVGLFGGEPDYENWATNLLDGFEDWVKDEAPVYHRPNYDQKSALQQMISSEFWGDEVAQGVGFWAGNLLPMVLFRKVGIPRMKGLNIASRSGFGAKVMNQVSKVAKMKAPGRYLSPEQLNNVGIIGYSVMQTHSEAMAEAGFLGKELRETFQGMIDRGELKADGSPWTWEDANKQIKNAMQNHYQYNLGVLGISNTIINKMLFGMAKPTKDYIARAVSGATPAAGFDKAAKLAKYYSGRIAKGVLTEGFWEEGSQTAGEMRFKEAALAGKLEDDNFLSVWDKAGKRFSYDYMNMLDTKEGVKAIAIGGLLGSVSGLVEAHGELKANEEFGAAVAEARNKNLLTHLGLFQKVDMYQRDDKGQIIPDDQGLPKISDKYNFLSEQTKEALVAEQAYIESLYKSNPELAERYVRDTVIPQILTFYAQSEELMEFLELELDNEGGEFMDMMKGMGAEPIMTKADIMSRAREIRAHTFKTQNIENMFMALKSVRDDLKANTDEIKGQPESFIQDFMRGTFLRYQLEIDNLNRAINNLDPTIKSEEKQRDITLEKVKALEQTRDVILNADPKQWERMYIAWKKGQQELSDVITDLSIKRSMHLSKPDKKDQEKPQEETAVSKFMDSSRAFLVDKTRGTTRTFAAEYMFKNEKGENIIAIAEKNSRGDLILLKDKHTGEYGYAYDPSTGIIQNYETGEILQGQLKTHRKAVTKRKQAAQKSFKKAIDALLDVIKSNMTYDKMTAAQKKIYIRQLERLAKSSPFVSTDKTLDILEDLNTLKGFADDMQDYFEELMDIVDSINDTMHSKLRGLNPSLESQWVEVRSSAYIDIIPYLEKLRDEAKASKDYKNFAQIITDKIAKLKKIDKKYQNRRDTLIPDLLTNIVSSVTFSEDLTKEEIPQLFQNFLSRSDSDDGAVVFSTMAKPQRSAEFRKPRIFQPRQVFRPAIDEKGMLTRITLLMSKADRTAEDDQLLKYLHSQLALIDYYRNTSDMLPARLISMQSFIDGRVAKDFGQDTSDVLSRHLYFYYTNANDEQRVITPAEFSQLDDEQKTDVIERIRNDVKFIPISFDNTVPINGKLEKLTPSIETSEFLVPHTSMMSKGNLLNYEFGGVAEERYRIVDLDSGLRINEQVRDENEDTETTQRKQELLDNFREMAFKYYDATMEAAQEKVVTLTFESLTSGALNQDVWLPFGNVNIKVPTIGTMLESLGEPTMAEMFTQNRIITRTKAGPFMINNMTFNVEKGLPYALIGNRLLPMSAKTLSKDHVKEIITLLEVYRNPERDVQVSFQQIRNYIRSITHLSSRMGSIGEESDYALSIDAMANGDIAVVINGESYNISQMAPNEWKEVTAQLERVLSSKFYNILRTSNGKQASAGVYDRVIMDQGSMILQKRSPQQYYNELGDRFQMYFDVDKLKDGVPLVYNSAAQFSTNETIAVDKPTDTEILTTNNLPTLDEYDSFFQANIEAYEALYNDLMDWSDEQEFPNSDELIMHLDTLEDIVIEVQGREDMSTFDIIRRNASVFLNIMDGNIEFDTDLEQQRAFFDQLREIVSFNSSNNKPLGETEC